MKHVISVPRSTSPLRERSVSHGSLLSQSPLRAMEDSVESFVYFMIQDYLAQKGLRRTLNAFNSEAETVNGIAPSPNAWYTVSEELDMPALYKTAEEFTGKRYTTAAEVFAVHVVRSVMQTREGEQSHGSDNDGNASAATVPLPRAQPKRKTQKKAKKLLPWEELDDDDAGTEPADIVHERFDPAAIQKNVEELHEESRKYVKKQSITSLLVHMVNSTPKEGAAAQPAEEPAKGRQVEEVKALAPVKPKKRSKAATTVSSLAQSLLTTGGSRLLARRDAQRILDEEMSDVPATSTNAPPLPQPSSVSWMPMETRMKLLKRELHVTRQNRSTYEVLEKDRSMRFSTQSALLREKEMERLSGGVRRRPRRCALCSMEYALVNLPTAISFKAIIDLHTRWGFEDESPLAGLNKPPHCYNTVRICAFCSQFFDEDHSYRAPDAGVPESCDLYLEYVEKQQSMRKPGKSSSPKKTRKAAESKTGEKQKNPPAASAAVD